MIGTSSDSISDYLRRGRVKQSTSWRTGGGWSRREMLKLRRDTPSLDGRWQLVISPDRCTDCRACVRSCQPLALLRHQEEKAVVYTLEARLCNGCELCSQICAAAALNIQRAEKPTDLFEAVRLPMTCCSEYGERGAGHISRLCQICRQYRTLLEKTSPHKI